EYDVTIWDRLPIIGARGGVWDKLEKSLSHPAGLGADGGGWGQLTIPPGGLWGELQDETLPLRPPGRDLWQAPLPLPRPGAAGPAQRRKRRSRRTQRWTPTSGCGTSWATRR